MKQRLNEIADYLIAAISTDTPRGSMKSAASELKALAAEPPTATDEESDAALNLRDQIRGYQYGVKFGDGSMRSGRDMSSKEQKLITDALTFYAKRSKP